jgi:hypothetical protein
MSMITVIARAERSVARREPVRALAHLARGIAASVAAFAATWRQSIDEARALERAARARHPFFAEW